MNPSILIDGFRRFLLHAIIALHHIVSLRTNFPLFDANLTRRQCLTCTARNQVIGATESNHRRTFRHAVPLHQINTQSMHSFPYLRVQGGATTDASLQITSHHVMHLLEYQSGETHTIHLLAQIIQSTRQHRSIHFLHDALVERLPQTRHSHHQAYPTYLHRLHDVGTTHGRSNRHA